MLSAAIGIVKRQRAAAIAAARPARGAPSSADAMITAFHQRSGASSAAVNRLAAALDRLRAGAPSAESAAAALNAVGEVLAAKKVDLDFSQARVDGRTLHVSLWVDDVLAWASQAGLIMYGRGAMATVLSNLSQPDGGLVGLLTLALELATINERTVDTVIVHVVCDNDEHFTGNSGILGCTAPSDIGEIKIPLFVEPKRPPASAALPISERGIIPAAGRIIEKLRSPRIRMGDHILDPSDAMGDPLHVRLFTRVAFRVAEHDRRRGSRAPAGPFRRAVPRRTDVLDSVLDAEADEVVRSTSVMHRCFRPLCTHLSHNLLRCSRCKAAFYCGTACQRLDWNRHKILCAGRRDAEPPHDFDAGDGGFKDAEEEEAQLDAEEEDELSGGGPREKPLWWSNGKLVTWRDEHGRTRIDWMARFLEHRLVGSAAGVSIDSRLNENEDEPAVPTWRAPEYAYDFESDRESDENDEKDEDEDDDWGAEQRFAALSDRRRGYRGHESSITFAILPPPSEVLSWMPMFPSMIGRIVAGALAGESASCGAGAS